MIQHRVVASQNLEQGEIRNSQTPSKRKKIFTQQASPIEQTLNSQHENPNYQKILIQKNMEIQVELFQVIDKLNTRLEQGKRIEQQNLHLKEQNKRLKQMIDGKVQYNIIKREREDLILKNEQLIKRIEKARFLAELLKQQNYKEELLQVLQL